MKGGIEALSSCTLPELSLQGAHWQRSEALLRRTTLVEELTYQQVLPHRADINPLKGTQEWVAVAIRGFPERGLEPGPALGPFRGLPLSLGVSLVGLGG